MSWLRVEGITERGFVHRGDPLQLVRDLTKLLLEAGVVDGIVSGVSKEGKVVLHVVKSADELDEAILGYVLVHSYQGLESTVRAIRDRKGDRLAALVKPCEARAIIELAKRRRIDLNSVFIVGFDCPGMRTNQDASGEVMEALRVTPGDEVLKDACRRCEVHAPPYADVCVSLISSPEVTLVEAGTERGAKVLETLRGKGVIIEGQPRELITKREEKLRLLNERGRRTLKEEENKLLSVPGHERFSWFMSQLDACVKCSACIRACPICFCKDCILISKRKEYTPSLFLVTRMLHMADSCVCCGKCDEVCPKSIPLSYMFYHLGRKFTSRHSYLAGVDFSRPPRTV
ncbi:MAG: hypothetical protein QXY80_03060 [Candidatus Jordarchaeales archaeon]